MTDCEAIESQLLELRDGTLDATAEKAIEAHLAGCTRCQEFAHWDRRIAALVRVDIPPSPGLSATVRRRLRRRMRRTAVLAYATAAAALIASALSMWHLGIEESQPTIVEVRGKAPARSEDLTELPALFEPPPVDSLDVLNRQQDIYVAALQKLGEKQ